MVFFVLAVLAVLSLLALGARRSSARAYDLNEWLSVGGVAAAAGQCQLITHGAVVEPQPGLLRLLCRNLEPFAFPQPLNTLVVDLPAGLTKQRSDAAVAISTIPPRQFGHVGDETFLSLASSGDMALCRTLLAEHATGAAFGDA